jgi:hypothetical protein
MIVQFIDFGVSKFSMLWLSESKVRLAVAKMVSIVLKIEILKNLYV